MIHEDDDGPDGGDPHQAVVGHALLGIGDDSDAINYIARPNGMITMPVPAAVWLFGSALGLLAWVRRRS